MFIGLIFIFLLYSLLATIFLELYATIFALRAKLLQKAIRRMLMDGAADADNLLGDLGRWLAAPFRRIFSKASETDKSAYTQFFDHPSIKYLGEGRIFRRPSYLHGHNFSQVMIDLLRGPGYDGRTTNESTLIRDALEQDKLKLPSDTKRQLEMLFANSKQDASQFKHKLEDWFEEMMERTTGWYKRQTQFLLIIIGFILAWNFNVDTIAIAQILMKDDDARARIVDMAIAREKTYGAIIDSVGIKKVKVIKTYKNNGDTTAIEMVTDSVVFPGASKDYLDSTRQQLLKDAAEVQGILGLKGIPDHIDSTSCNVKVHYLDSLLKLPMDTAAHANLVKLRAETYTCCLKKNAHPSNPYQQSGPIVIFFGWLITALAVSLGAPFWFDLLNKFVKLRGTGPQVSNTSAIDNGSKGNTTAAGNPVKDNNNNDIKG
ncbi:hypothetical protein [Paraflavitalea pollutisoli]|uniref:hypothetical protein n=1 Tax=Paraflavitalea pollutisoli TaxID=3034143 RepID=UPI0023ED3C8F|nr:hypothetical protein [Paraflavitalea sp. H1-2-19X]